jgi:hypothetical protein
MSVSDFRSSGGAAPGAQDRRPAHGAPDVLARSADASLGFRRGLLHRGAPERHRIFLGEDDLAFLAAILRGLNHGYS